ATGPEGPTGPQGATGPQGPAGRDAQVKCTATGTKHVTVTCKVTFASASKRALTRVVLMRGTKLAATGVAVPSCRSGLPTVRRLRPGAYRLVIAQIVQAKAHTVSHRTIRI